MFVVAPDREQSAVGHALTLHRPLRVDQVGGAALRGQRHAVGLREPRACSGSCRSRRCSWSSGINHGSNLGDDVTYSGTVSAAMEGTLLGRAVDGGVAGGAARRRASRRRARWRRRSPARSSWRGSRRKTLLNVNVPRGRGERHPAHAARPSRLPREGDPGGGPARAAVLLDRRRARRSGRRTRPRTSPRSTRASRR